MFIEIGLKSGKVFRDVVTDQMLRDSEMSLSEFTEAMTKLAKAATDESDSAPTVNTFYWDGSAGTAHIKPSAIEYFIINTDAPVQNKVTLEGTSVTNED